MKPLQTQRLNLRLFTPDDVDVTHALIYTDPRVKWGGADVDLEGTRDRVLHWADTAQWNDFGHLAVERRTDGQFLGMMVLEVYLANFIVFKDAPDDPCNTLEVELGYVLGRDFWGHGYATEAGCAVVDYAFNDLRLHRLVSATSKDNNRSLRVMEKLGCRFEENLHPEWRHRILGILDNPMIAST